MKRKFNCAVLFFMLTVFLFTLFGNIIAPAAVSAYTVSAGSTFNNPFSSYSSTRYAVINQINSAIDNTPKGHYIRIATYSIKYKVSADKLIAAHKRGVKVQIITDNHLYDIEDRQLKTTETSQLERLKLVLGTTVASDRSFLKVCDDGCMSTAEYSSVHAKIYMFSRSGDSRYVSMVSSSNLSAGHSMSWNNLYKVVNNLDYYNGLKSYFTAMSTEPNKGDWYSNTAYGKHRLYTFPRIVSSMTEDDVYYTMLEKVRCTGAATGYGYTGKTVVNLAMFKWSDDRNNVLSRLIELKKQGCIIKVATSADATYRSTLKALIDAGIPVRDEDKWDSTHTNIVRYMHHKYITINGYYLDANKTDAQNRQTKLVFTGSPNLTSSGLKHNNEILVRIDDATQYSRYNSNFNLLFSKYGRVIKSGEGYVPPSAN